VGFIGSHTVVELLQCGCRVTIVDNFCNSKPECLERIQEIAKSTNVQFFEVDIGDAEALEKVFKSSGKFDSCIHFAALKAVGESLQQPLAYYSNNVGGTLTLLTLLAKYGCKSIVFSSSATVYGSSPSPLSEDSTTGTGITNPYGQTKHMMEQIMTDLYKSDKEWGVVLLRYFNPVGAHESGRIGEDPAGIPNNLMPFVQQVAVGKRPHLNVFGNDYDTVDGTGVRDYIHVCDLAEGHVKALAFLDKNGNTGHSVFNLGSGKGSSVLQVVAGMTKACGHDVPYKISPRRGGDLATVYAKPDKAEKLLAFKTKHNMDRMCQDSWRWISQNPDGFPTTASCPCARWWVSMYKQSQTSKVDEVSKAFASICAAVKAKSKTLETPRKHILSRQECVQIVAELQAAGVELEAIQKELRRTEGAAPPLPSSE